ncbi:MAG: spermidine synthase [Pseudomonadota bacterium]
MKNYNKILDGWFSEICPSWPGIANCFKIEKILYSKQSKFQQIDVYKTQHHGNMLVLDGLIQLTQLDEFAYQEMLAHVPLFAHPDPKYVLVIGGGDGGVLREVARHPGIESIDFCEIDEAVMAVSKQFLPEMACGFDDPRVNIYIEDGNGFVQKRHNRYDVIIVDSSDPIGPATKLFEKPFYQALKSALRPNGLVASQGESFFLHQDCVKKLAGITKQVFPIQAYAYIIVPTYPGGHIGVCLGSLGPNPEKPNRLVVPAIQDQLKYYTPQIHEACFVLPHFANKMIEQALIRQ